MKKITNQPIYSFLLMFCIMTISTISYSQDSPEKQTFEFTNNTGEDVNDLHIKFSNGVIPQNLVTDDVGVSRVGGVFAQYPTTGTPTQHDYAQGEVEDGESITIQFNNTTKVREWWWTIDGVREGPKHTGRSDDLDFLAFTPIPEGGSPIDILPYSSIGYIPLENACNETVFGLTATLWHPDPTINVPNIISLEITDQEEFYNVVDDNYNGQIDDFENDHINNAATPYCRSFFPKGLHAGESLELRFELSELAMPGTVLQIQFNKRQASVYYDLLSSYELTEPGTTTLSFIPTGTQNGSFKAYNNSDNYLAVAILPPSEFFLEQMVAEPPYEYTSILSFDGETILHFDPPIPPYDYVNLNFSLPYPHMGPTAPMMMIPVETFPHECNINLEELAISECIDLNYYTIDINATINSDIKYCREFTFTNNLNQAASDLHYTFRGTGGSLEVQIVDNAPGCDDPQIPSNGTITNRMDIIWNSACVDPGETVKVKVCTENHSLLPDGGFWTLNGENIGELKQADVGVGAEGGQSQKGIGCAVNGNMLGVLDIQQGTASGTYYMEAELSAPQELMLEVIGESFCHPYVATYDSPFCFQESSFLDCNELTTDEIDVPVDWYPWEHVLPNRPKVIESGENAIASLKIIPPQLLNEDEMYVCGEDYWVSLSPEGLPAKMAVLEFARPGSYFLEVIYEDGTVERKIIIVDERCIQDIGENGFCFGGVFHEFPCGEPDIAVVSDPLGFEHSWGETGVKCKDLKAAAKAICDAAKEKGGPVSVVLNGHGGPGYIRIGTDKLNSETVQDFIDAIKGKVSELTLLSCSTARGEEGEALLNKLSEELGITVTGYTGVVSDIMGPPARWFTVGDKVVVSDLFSLPTQKAAPWQVNIFPNPSRGHIQLQYQSDQPIDISWQLSNAQGHIILNQRQADNNQRISLEPYPPGLYYLSFTDGKYFLVKKVVKLR